MTTDFQKKKKEIKKIGNTEAKYATLLNTWSRVTGTLVQVGGVILGSAGIADGLYTAIKAIATGSLSDISAESVKSLVGGSFALATAFVSYQSFGVRAGKHLAVAGDCETVHAEMELLEDDTDTEALSLNEKLMQRCSQKCIDIAVSRPYAPFCVDCCKKKSKEE